MTKIEIEILSTGYKVTVKINGAIVNTQPLYQTEDDLIRYLRRILGDK